MYTENRYQSYNLDYVTYEELKKTLKELDLKKEAKFFFKNKKYIYFIEFVSSPVAIDEQFKILKTSYGSIILTDWVKDRLAAWSDKEFLEQAILVAQSQKIDLQKIKTWSIKEKQNIKHSLKNLKK